jgi:hypothetical protein
MELLERARRDGTRSPAPFRRSRFHSSNHRPAALPDAAVSRLAAHHEADGAGQRREERADAMTMHSFEQNTA